MLRRTALAACCLIFLGGNALASQTPRATIHILWGNLLGAARIMDKTARNTFIENALQRYFDFTAFYESALQDHWPSWTPEQKSQFSSLFKAVFVKRLVREIGKVPTHGISFEQEKFTPDERGGVFSLVGRRGKDSVPIEISLIKHNESWKAYDISVDGALLSRQYRGQFNRILRKENFDGLISRLEKNLIK